MYIQTWTRFYCAGLMLSIRLGQSFAIRNSNIASNYLSLEPLTNFIFQLGQFPTLLSAPAYVILGFLVLSPLHSLVYTALSFFDSIYDPELWPCGTIYLTQAYTKLAGVSVRILPREAFYPVPWQEVTKFFTEDDITLWTDIISTSYAFHLWGKVTTFLQPSSSSLAWRILNSFSVSNLPVYNVTF